MTEEEPTFDPTMKKKKKKKKITDFEEEEEAEAQEAEAPAAEEAKEPTEENMEEDFSMLKKKKKKKKPIDLGELEDALPKEEEEDFNPDEGEPLPGEEDDLDFSLSTKKKKKKKVKIVDGDTEMTEKEETSENVTSLASSAWQDSDRDYTYDELLNRVFDIMREKNPDLVAGEKKRFVMKPPQVMRVGTKKTSFSNFAEICRMLRRQHKHVLAFLLAELGTSGSIDGNNQLIMKGRFQQKHLESVLRRYIKEYVTCHTCRSPDTNLQKDTRLYFLQCETCGSRCSVASIKAGFKAVTGKRAAIRAKTA